MKSQSGINAALEPVEGSQPFQKMTADFYRMGNLPDINEIPKLIQNKQPQHTALHILENAKFKQMLDVMVEEHRIMLRKRLPRTATRSLRLAATTERKTYRAGPPRHINTET